MKPQYQKQGQNLNKMRTTPQIQVEEQSLTMKKRPTSKHWQTECRRQRVKENNRRQRYTMQQDKNTICRQN